MLTQQQIDFFNENGFLCVEQVYSPAEIAQLSTDLSYMMDTFAFWQGGWRGAWRKEYMEAEEDGPATAWRCTTARCTPRRRGPAHPSPCTRTTRSIHTPMDDISTP